MTHTAEQERALADLRHLYAQMVGGLVKDSAQAKRIADGILSRAIQKLEQAARRAPAVPVPDVTDAMREAAEEAYMPFGDMGLAIQCALAAAPQPPEVEENPLQEQLDEALQSLEFYKRRCDLLQSIQPRMRDPERTMVCDVLANGHLLQSGDGQPDKARYAPPEAAPVELPEPVAVMTDTTPREPGWKTIFVPDAGTKLYTEQQVRQLLAAHGIKEQST